MRARVARLRVCARLSVFVPARPHARTRTQDTHACTRSLVGPLLLGCAPGARYMANAAPGMVAPTHDTISFVGTLASLSGDKTRCIEARVGDDACNRDAGKRTSTLCIIEGGDERQYDCRHYK